VVLSDITHLDSTHPLYLCPEEKHLSSTRPALAFWRAALAYVQTRPHTPNQSLSVRREERVLAPRTYSIYCTYVPQSTHLLLNPPQASCRLRSLDPWLQGTPLLRLHSPSRSRGRRAWDAEMEVTMGTYFRRLRGPDIWAWRPEGMSEMSSLEIGMLFHGLRGCCMRWLSGSEAMRMGGW